MYEIAINQGLYPVSKFIEERYIADERRNFFTEWNAAFVERYASEFGYLTERTTLARRIFYRTEKRDRRRRRADFLRKVRTYLVGDQSVRR